MLRKEESMQCSALIALVSALLTGSIANAAPDPNRNLLINGSFETGDFSGWGLYYVDEDGRDSPQVSQYFDGPSGGNYVVIISTVDYFGSFFQFVDTVPGTQYVLKYAVKKEGSDCGDFYGIFTCDKMAISVGNTYYVESGAKAHDWRRRTLYFTALSDRTLLAVGADTPFAAGYLFDDFRLALATANIPEPGTWLMMIAGFGIVGAAVRRSVARAVVG